MAVTTTVRRTAALSALRQKGINLPSVVTDRSWRQHDPDPTVVSQLNPDQFGKRVVIRSHDVVGTVYGTLLESAPHDSMPDFTVIHLFQQTPYLLRNDTEVIVLDF